MAWNGYRSAADWQDGWNGWKSNSVWYEQPTEGSYAHNHDEYGSWQLSSGGMGQQSSGGYSATARPSADQSRAPQKPKPCSFDALRALQGLNDSDDSDTEVGVSDHHPSDRDSAAGSGSPIKSRSDSSDDETKVGKSATQEEREEAERIVGQAMHDVKERDRMRSKVSTASPADLQAMLNARLKR